MRKVSSLLGAVALTLVVAGTAQAQARFGGQLNFGTDSDFGVGGRLEIDMTGKMTKNPPFSRAFFMTQVDLYFPDCGASGVDCSWLEINPGLAIRIPATNIDPYVGAGLNIARISSSFGGSSTSNTETGLNLIGGIRFPLSTLSAFTEARLALGDNDQLALSFGLLFGKAPPPAKSVKRR